LRSTSRRFFGQPAGGQFQLRKEIDANLKVMECSGEQCRECGGNSARTFWSGKMKVWLWIYGVVGTLHFMLYAVGMEVVVRYAIGPYWLMMMAAPAVLSLLVLFRLFDFSGDVGQVRGGVSSSS
jgi:hypothetical protein